MTQTAAKTVTEYEVTRVKHVVLSNVFPGYADHYVVDAESVLHYQGGNGQGTGGQRLHFRWDGVVPVGAKFLVTVELSEDIPTVSEDVPGVHDYDDIYMESLTEQEN